MELFTREQGRHDGRPAWREPGFKTPFAARMPLLATSGFRAFGRSASTKYSFRGRRSVAKL
jgi:hypothetical protein